MSTMRGRRLVIVVAWLFVAGSLAPLLDGLGWPPFRTVSDQDATYIMRATAYGKEYTSWGLTYIGQRGHTLRLAEVLAVAAAAGLSLLRHDGARRVGLLALAVWAGLWLGNAMRMAYVAPFWVFYLVLALCLLFFAATAGRAALCWTRRTP